MWLYEPIIGRLIWNLFLSEQNVEAQTDDADFAGRLSNGSWVK